jgi:hypothetical protein
MSDNDEIRPTVSDSNPVLAIRLKNIERTQLGLQRLLILIYIFALILSFAWYNANFEVQKISRDISLLKNALNIEVLRPWFNFLKETHNCFHSYYNFAGGSGFVTKIELEKYIEQYEASNKKREQFIRLELDEPYPVSKLRELLNSETHWEHVTFWERQDTILSHMLSLSYYLSSFKALKFEAQLKDSLDSFYHSYSNINRSTDSMLMAIGSFVDSLLEPVRPNVSLGLNPYDMQGSALGNIWGWADDFKDLNTYGLGDLVYSLQVINSITIFKKYFDSVRHILNSVKSDLNIILHSMNDEDSIKFTSQGTNLRFTNIDLILSSDIWKMNDLPDSIWLPGFAGSHKISPYSGLFTYKQNLLKESFPDFLEALKTYKIDKIDGLQNMTDIMLSRHNETKQQIYGTGFALTLNSIFYALPLVILCVYFLILLYFRHLRILKYSREIGITVESFNYTYREIAMAPLLWSLGSRKLGMILTLLPGAIVNLVLYSQLLLSKRSGVDLGLIFILPISTIYLLLLYNIVRISGELSKRGGKP